MDEETRGFIRGRESFLEFLSEWECTWPSPALADVIREAAGPENVAIVAADVLVGFCSAGRLAGTRVARIVPPIVDLFKRAHSLGVRNFVLPQDAHPPDSPEFDAWGPHCVVGSEEAETVAELKALPFSNLFEVIPNQNLNAGIGTGFPAWLDEHRNVRCFIVVGDCTDLCIYQTAMYLRLRADQFRLDYEVIVPEDCVDTFDIPLVDARKRGVLPHDAELLHSLFLYHMAVNGIRVIRRLTG
ncbi:MAG TPA: isochorismatase family cysteine hydrolase [Armatimonadota bacterium]|nr:isochorismatase family cysteine hydrolase [Armatimonadota bacterium]